MFSHIPPGCKCFLSLFLFFPAFCVAQNNFPVATSTGTVSIVYSKSGAALDSIAAYALAGDIERVTGQRPQVLTDVRKAGRQLIVIGQAGAPLVQQFLGWQAAWADKLKGKWECYGWKVAGKPMKNIDQALVIAGSDARGTAYGVFALSEKIGVSPWYWWADVPVKPQQELILHQPDTASAEPAVRYRGIFINDEDWGLQPWAAKTFEPETGDIGPKTYAKVFELLLRLKANLIWPAMHPGTKPFYHYPRNKQVAEAYAIVIGSSHAEPMLRNNVGEWDTKAMGPFNYLSNRDKVLAYWESRVRETSGNDVLYTLGMRGVHDSGMEGVKDPKEAVPLLERIFRDQRGLLEKYRHTTAGRIPQVFTAYKEVLDIYDKGLKVPEDVTLVWPDDNYGYIHRLSTEVEQRRPGGSGVYYHASYWGRPHDYLWLGTTHPALMRMEMMKAYANGAHRLWVLNVGDIKPLEYNMQLFLDMAYGAAAFQEGGSEQKHLQAWCGKIFGGGNGAAIAETMWAYYQLAFERRPEFMGWSQTEPTTKTKYTAYNHFHFGDEAQRRIDRYERLERRVKLLRQELGAGHQAAFYQLVYYPVMSASWMNKKFLYRDKAWLYAKQQRVGAYQYALQSRAVYDSIVAETAWFNDQLSGGKWKGILSMRPRELPVYLAPELSVINFTTQESWNLAPEGYDTLAYQKGLPRQLPRFVAGATPSYFIDVYLCDSSVVEWGAQPSAGWIKLSVPQGTLRPAGHEHTTRLWVSIDWDKVPAGVEYTGSVEVIAKGKTMTVGITAWRPGNADLRSFKGAVEQNGVVSIPAARYDRKVEEGNSGWQLVPGLGHTGAALQARVGAKAIVAADGTVAPGQWAAHAAYQFYSFSGETPKLSVYTLPTHPLNPEVGMRYAVSVDDAPLQLVDFTTVGRSEEWKQNVLRNAAIRELALPRLEPGMHILKVYVIDPGVVLDRMVISFGEVAKCYGLVQETY